MKKTAFVTPQIRAYDLVVRHSIMTGSFDGGSANSLNVEDGDQPGHEWESLD